MEKPLILITNDDGIASRGIKLLVELMGELGELLVVAPDSPQSGMGHAVTVGNKITLGGDNRGIRAVNSYAGKIM